jgi:hypothetical protein
MEYCTVLGKNKVILEVQYSNSGTIMADPTEYLLFQRNSHYRPKSGVHYCTILSKVQTVWVATSPTVAYSRMQFREKFFPLGVIGLSSCILQDWTSWFFTNSKRGMLHDNHALPHASVGKQSF